MKLKPLAGLLGMLLVTSPAYALTEVDTELQLLMDVSGSVSYSEFNLQLQGYVDAFYSQDVQSAILDTSGGNSGSPVIDARGRLVGVNHDRVWENVAGDFGFNPALSRNISVDIRYLLWTLKEVERAAHPLAEFVHSRAKVARAVQLFFQPAAVELVGIGGQFFGKEVFAFSHAGNCKVAAFFHACFDGFKYRFAAQHAGFHCRM